VSNHKNPCFSSVADIFDSIFGRFLPGILGDRFGRLNVLFAATILSGILTLALWVPAKNSVSVFVYAGLYGFSSGAYVSLGPSVVAQLSDIKEIGMRIGVLYFCVGIAVLIGNPIGGQLLIAMNGDFLGLQLFAGLTMVVGACIILSARVVIAGVGWKVV
jgi:MFS family permease